MNGNLSADDRFTCEGKVFGSLFFLSWNHEDNNDVIIPLSMAKVTLFWVELG